MDRRGDEIGIPQQGVAIGISQLHSLGHDVKRFRRTRAILFQVKIFNDVEHIEQGRTARTGRWRRYNIKAAIGPTQWLTLNCAIASQIIRGNQPAMRFHVGDKTFRYRAFVKAVCPVLGDLGECPCKVWLFQPFSCTIKRAIGLIISRFGGRAGRQALFAPTKNKGFVGGQDHAVAGERDGGRNDV